jgi:hypothetical protein
LSPTQQPLQLVALQVDEPHVAVTALHVEPPVVQFAHSWPPRPHAAASVPLKQRRRPSSVAQQPLHEAAPQVLSSRAQTRELSQSAKPLAMQSLHRLPIEPQARTSRPGRQVPVASQQPPGQLDGPHGETTPPSLRSSSSRLERPQPGAIATKSTMPSHASGRK